MSFTTFSTSYTPRCRFPLYLFPFIGSFAQPVPVYRVGSAPINTCYTQIRPPGFPFPMPHALRSRCAASARVGEKTNKQTPNSARQVNFQRALFFKEALRRIFLQSSRQRLRSIPEFFLSLLTSLFWYCRAFLTAGPCTLISARKRVSVNLAHTTADLYIPPKKLASSVNEADLLHAAVLYVHGGAWGAGDTIHAASLCKFLSSRGCISLAVKLRLFPRGTAADQARDVRDGAAYLSARYPSLPLVVIAHSSGAHVAALAALRHGLPDARALILQAGVYDLRTHYLYESGRGVASVSPMKPAAEADDNVCNLEKVSPAWVLAQEARVGARGVDAEDDSHLHGQRRLFLEGDMVAGHFAVMQARAGRRGSWPDTYVMAAETDSTAPLHGSVQFVNALRTAGARARLLVYDHMEHSDFVMDWARKRTPKDDILDISEFDAAARRECVERAYGEMYVRLVEEDVEGVPLNAHARDLVRIIEAHAAATDDYHFGEIALAKLPSGRNEM